MLPFALIARALRDIIFFTGEPLCNIRPDQVMVAKFCIILHGVVVYVSLCLSTSQRRGDKPMKHFFKLGSTQLLGYDNAS